MIAVFTFLIPAAAFGRRLFMPLNDLMDFFFNNELLKMSSLSFNVSLHLIIFTEIFTYSWMDIFYEDLSL